MNKPRLAWVITGSGHYIEERLAMVSKLYGPVIKLSDLATSAEGEV